MEVNLWTDGTPENRRYIEEWCRKTCQQHFMERPNWINHICNVKGCRDMPLLMEMKKYAE